MDHHWRHFKVYMGYPTWVRYPTDNLKGTPIDDSLNKHKHVKYFDSK